MFKAVAGVDLTPQLENLKEAGTWIAACAPFAAKIGIDNDTKMEAGSGAKVKFSHVLTLGGHCVGIVQSVKNLDTYKESIDEAWVQHAETLQSVLAAYDPFPTFGPGSEDELVHFKTCIDDCKSYCEHAVDLFKTQCREACSEHLQKGKEIINRMQLEDDTLKGKTACDLQKEVVQSDDGKKLFGILGEVNAVKDAWLERAAKIGVAPTMFEDEWDKEGIRQKLLDIKVIFGCVHSVCGKLKLKEKETEEEARNAKVSSQVEAWKKSKVRLPKHFETALADHGFKF